MTTKKTTIYLRNADLLTEIHRSKLSYCEFSEKRFQDYDVIVDDLDKIFTEEALNEAKMVRAKRLTERLYKQAKEENPKVKKKDVRINEDDIPIEDLVFRVYTYDHIPLDPLRKKTKRFKADHYVKLNFVPFKHFVIINEDGVLTPKEVGRSHSKNGKFSITHGRVTENLGAMCILLTNHYGQHWRWRGYSYLDEMKGQAIVQIMYLGLKFDESKTTNAFAYLTKCAERSFRKILDVEKKVQSTRDDLIMMSGNTPSFTRQCEIEDEIRRLRDTDFDGEI